MPASEARLRANKKYANAHYDSIRIDFPKGDKERIQTAASAQGMSVSAYIRNAVLQRLEADTQSPLSQNDTAIVSK